MKKPLALLGGLLIAGLMVPAQASHPTRQCLDLEPDRHHPTSSYGIDYLTATYGLSDDNHPPDQACHPEDVGVAGQDLNIDFEIYGVADPDNSDSPESPDLTCTIAADEQACSVIPPDSGGGDQWARGWVDTDLDDATVEADAGEEQDETSDPGESEPDFTDVALWSWTHADGPLRYGTTITIRYSEDRRAFMGEVESGLPRCESGRGVVLKEMTPDGSEPIRRTRSRGGGGWDIVMHREPHGSFRARAQRKIFTRGNGDTVVCNAGESRKISVP